MDIIQLISTLGGLASGLGLGFFTRSGRIKAQADAYKAMAEQYEFRLDQTKQTIKILNGIINEQSESIAKTNRDLDEKTSRIRDLTDKLCDAEQETNRVNGALSAEQTRAAALQRQIGDLRVALERYKTWHCRHAECPDRIPPNPALKGQKYEEQ